MHEAEHWSIPFDPLQPSRRPHRRHRQVFASQPPERVSEATTTARRLKTTGLFAIPRGAGGLVQLLIFISSTAEEAEQAEVSVGRLSGSRPTIDRLSGTLPDPEELIPCLRRSFTVEGGEAEKLQIPNLDGETVEVAVSLSSEELKPSVAVTKTSADGTTIVLSWISPSHFIPV